MNLDPRDHLGDDRLRQLYGRQAGTVAFVDESYLQHVGDNGLYSLSAVLVERPNDLALSALRAEFLQAVDAAKRGAWHTVDAYRSGDFERIHATLDFVAARAAWHVVTVDLPVRSAAEAVDARQRCLVALLKSVCGAGNNATIVVMDTRDRSVDGPGDRQDLQTVRRLHKAGRLAESVVVVRANDRREPLIAMADTIAWAFQRGAIRNDRQWWEHVREVATVLHARSGHELTLEMQQRPGGPSTPDRLTAPNAPGRSGGYRVVAEPLSHRGQDASREAFAPTLDPHERPMMDSLRAQIAAIEQRQRADAVRRRVEKSSELFGDGRSQRDDALPSFTPGQLIAKGMKSSSTPTLPPKPDAVPAQAPQERPRPPKTPRHNR